MNDIRVATDLVRLTHDKSGPALKHYSQIFTATSVEMSIPVDGLLLLLVNVLKVPRRQTVRFEGGHRTVFTPRRWFIGSKEYVVLGNSVIHPSIKQEPALGLMVLVERDVYEKLPPREWVKSLE